MIDPRPDVEIYLDLARKTGVSITHVLKRISTLTSSAARASSRRAPARQIYASGEGGAEYGFDRESVGGDEFRFER